MHGRKPWYLHVVYDYNAEVCEGKETVKGQGRNLHEIQSKGSKFYINFLAYRFE